MTTIHGLKSLVEDVKNCPRGFRVDIWAVLNTDGTVNAWTEGYLSEGQWHEFSSDVPYRCLGTLSRDAETPSKTIRAWIDDAIACGVLA